MAGFAMLANSPTFPNPEALKPWREKTFFGLFEKPVTEVKTDGSMSSNEPIFLSWNGIKAIQAKQGDNIAKLCLQSNLDKEDFLVYNDMRAFDAIQPGMVYYVKSKKNRAKVPFHTVKPGETLWEVSQNYGIKMQALLKKNRMKKPEKLKPGRVLYLRQTMPSDEPIRYEPVPDYEENNNTFIVKNKPVEPPKTSRKKEDSTLQVINQKLLASLKNDTIVNTDEADEDEETPTIAINLGKKSETLPTPAKPAAPASDVQTLAANKVPASPNVCVVEPGMTLYAIAKKCGVSVDSLLAWNNMMTGDLKVGQTLKTAREPSKITSAAPIQVVNKPTEATNWYEVKTGDTLYRIAREHGISIDELLKWNDKTEAKLSIGEKLKVRNPAN
jgi:membrane-bound lytic murein transglycosylase D